MESDKNTIIRRRFPTRNEPFYIFTPNRTKPIADRKKKQFHPHVVDGTRYRKKYIFMCNGNYVRKVAIEWIVLPTLCRRWVIVCSVLKYRWYFIHGFCVMILYMWVKSSESFCGNFTRQWGFIGFLYRWVRVVLKELFIVEANYFLLFIRIRKVNITFVIARKLY